MWANCPTSPEPHAAWRGSPLFLGYLQKRWQQHTNRHADAQLVCVVDFELAFQHLTLEEQTALALHYREGLGHSTVAAALGCSLRKLAYLIPALRQQLADILDRRDLL